MVARHFGSQGCIALPRGRDDVFFKPVDDARAHLPDANDDAVADGRRACQTIRCRPASTRAKLKRAIDAAFEPAEALTSAFVVTYKGRLIGERYMPGITATTPLESWSMGKSVTATLMGLLIQQGVYTLEQPAPIPEWQKAGDPRQKIRIAGHPAHVERHPDQGAGRSRLRSQGDLSRSPVSLHRPRQLVSSTPRRVRSSGRRTPSAATATPIRCLTNYLVRLAVEKRGEDYLSFPQRNLFDKIGIRSMVMETDPYGNFLTQGYELMSGRDWARLGNLYLQDGVWNGERILPEGFVKFVSTVAPAWAADRRPVYGGFFWINGDGTFPVPKEAYYMSGAGGQTVLIIPSHDLVVVRIGHYKGQEAGEGAFKSALTMLMEAVPRSARDAAR